MSGFLSLHNKPSQNLVAKDTNISYQGSYFWVSWWFLIGISHVVAIIHLPESSKKSTRMAFSAPMPDTLPSSIQTFVIVSWTSFLMAQDSKRQEIKTCQSCKRTFNLELALHNFYCVHLVKTFIGQSRLKLAKEQLHILMESLKEWQDDQDDSHWSLHFVFMPL